MHPWPELKWWDSGERQAAEEKYDDLIKSGVVCNPEKARLYRALSATPEGEVRVMVIGQDPYPTPGYSTGVAFSIPKDIPRDKFPHTLRIILAEYCLDLGYESPSSGDLSPWTKQGVLLWNSIPCVQSGRPLSCDWPEWGELTGQIIQRVASRGGVVFVCLGNVAYSHVDGKVDESRNRVLRTSHPSPRGIRSSRSPFTGSRIFSTTNAKLRELGQAPIDWRLDHVDSTGTGDGKSPELGGGNVLPNITGAKLGGLKRATTSPNIYTSLAF